MIPRWPALAVSLAVAIPAAAQVPVPAQTILAVADDLQLTQLQIDKLHALERSQLAATTRFTAAYLRAEADLLDAIRGEDLIIRRTALEKRAKIAIDAEIARLQAEKDSRAVLLPEQRKKLPMAGSQVGSTTVEAVLWQPLIAPPPVSRTITTIVADSGVARLKVSPTYAEIIVDSVKVGTGFKQLTLPVGVHTARFQAPGCGAPVEQTITINKGELVIVPPVTLKGC